MHNRDQGTPGLPLKSSKISLELDQGEDAGVFLVGVTCTSPYLQYSFKAHNNIETSD